MSDPSPTDGHLPETQAALLQEWQQGLRIRHIAHSRAAGNCQLRARVLGVAVVVLSTAVGTSIFAVAEGSIHLAWRIAAGLLSALAAILAAVQTSLAYPQLAERHRVAALAYGALRRAVEAYLAAPDVPPAEAIERFRHRWDELAAEAPDLHMTQHADARAATGAA